MRRHGDEIGQFDSVEIAVLMAAMRRAADQRYLPAVKARLREFQKRSFPGAANAGRGKRALFGLDELLQATLAFELIDVDLSASRCIEIVNQSAPVLTHAALLAWRIARSPQSTADGSRRLLAHVVPSSVTHGSGAMVAFDEGEHYAAQPRWPGRRSRIVLDITAIVADLMAALESELFRALPEEVDQMFRGLGEERFGSNDPADWPGFSPDTRDDRVPR